MPGATQKAPKKTKYTRPKSRKFMLSNDEEERFNGYIAAMNEVRFKGSSGRGSLPDLLRLIARSHNHARLRTNVMKAIEEDEVIGELFPAAISTDKAEHHMAIQGRVCSAVNREGFIRVTKAFYQFFSLILFDCKQRAYN